MGAILIQTDMTHSHQTVTSHLSFQSPGPASSFWGVQALNAAHPSLVQLLQGHGPFRDTALHYWGE